MLLIGIGVLLIGISLFGLFVMELVRTIQNRIRHGRPAGMSDFDEY